MGSRTPAKAGLVVVTLLSLAGCAVESTDQGPSDQGANTPLDGSSSSSGTPVSGDPPAGMLDAMTRDLHLTVSQVRDLLRVEAEAARTEPKLRELLADTFAGAWMKQDGKKLAVGITDAGMADLVRDMGAEPVLVKRNLAQLAAIKGGLDKAVALAGDDIHDWYVDVATNTVVVNAKDPSSRAVRDFIGQAEAVRVVESKERPRPLYDVRGGDEIILNRSALCSMGFAVNGGYVTAGHCGRTGVITQGSNWVDSGVVRGSVFPGNDWAWIETNGQWNTLGVVNNYSGGTVAVAGSNVASVGSSICRSGRTTGWRCGVVQAHNVTINYADGPVYSATRTSTCAEGGDSGGSFISGDQAQGVTSGGSGNCSTGGTTFFQPINPILSTYGLTLKTTGGGGGGKAIVSRLNNKCIDVPGSNFVDGARLQMYTCNGTGAQKWTFVNGTVRAGGKCMDVAWANPADGTAVQLTACNGNQAQQFVLNAAGDLVSVLANKCVDIGGWNQNDGAQLVIWPCHGGNNQKWFTRGADGEAHAGTLA